MSLLSFSRFYLVGIKGVAMTALAQCLLDASKTVSGSDVAGSFVTQHLLDERQLQIDTSFTTPIPEDVDCVIYTAAHQGPQNPQVIEAQSRGIPVLSHAEALSHFFNAKQGIAVCGVGGKSTTSAMIAWILADTDQQPSFAVGVGNIIGLNKTGQWHPESPYFVAEADEYVTDPAAPHQGIEITPRFSFLHPQLTVCTNLKFDHPDVYQNFDHTQAVFNRFFTQIKAGGTLIANADDQALMGLVKPLETTQDLTLLTFGEAATATLQLVAYQPQAQKTISRLRYQNQEYQLQLAVPGKFNVMNALGALAAVLTIGTSMELALKALARFQSTWRRSQFMGEKQQVLYYDDYAHHPDEVKQVIQAFKEWFPERRLIVAFQSHTFSRTRALFDDFVTALSEADVITMIDIFASAREADDDTMNSDLLCQAIIDRYPGKTAINYQTLSRLVAALSEELRPGDVCLTIGAGDIYELHALISKDATIDQ